MIGGNARDKPFPYISFNSTVLLVVCMCSMCKFIKGSLDEKLPSYELLKMLNNRFVK